MLKNVLLVEDQGLVRAGMKSLLQRVEPAALISEAGSYEEALAQLGRVAFDLVFLDLDLREEKNGLDLLRYIRELDLPLKVIMLSAHDDRETVLDCIAAGASGYIAKSSDDEGVFEEALTTVFQDGVYLPASIVRCDDHPRQRWNTPLGGGVELKLAPRLTEVLYYLCQGLSNKGIANRMGISEGTVRKSYVSELLRHFNVTRRTELIIEISRLGIRLKSPAA